MDLTQKSYSIGDTAEMTGVSQRMLRAWEGRHIDYPSRIVCGDRAYRRYSEMDIKLIKLIREYQDQGYTLKMASRKAHSDLGLKEVL